MTGIQDYSTTANSNTSLFPENMSPASLNNKLRDMQVDVRNWYNEPNWVEYGDSSGSGDGTTVNYVIAYIGATQFSISGDVTSAYNVGRKIRATVNAGSYLYGTITASSYSNPNTTVTVSWLSTTLTSGTLRVWLGGDTGAAATTALSGSAFDAQEMSPVLLGPTEKVQSLSSSSGVLSITPANGGIVNVTLTENISSIDVTWGSGARAFTLNLTQDGTGGRTVAWPSAWLWPNGNEPTMTSTAGARDKFVVETHNGGTTVDAASGGQNYS